MESRRLGHSGFSVPVLSFGTGTFGGSNEFFQAWGSTQSDEATRLVDICLDAGLTMFDSADIYSDGLSEKVLGHAIKGRRDKVIVSTKATFRSGPGPNDVGSSASTSSRPSRPRCGGSEPTTSTFSSCTVSTPRRRSRKRSARSTTSYAPARSATSAARTSPAGT